MSGDINQSRGNINAPLIPCQTASGINWVAVLWEDFCDPWHEADITKF